MDDAHKTALEVAQQCCINKAQRRDETYRKVSVLICQLRDARAELRSRDRQLIEAETALRWIEKQAVEQ